MALVEEGYEIVLATPDGGKSHIDPRSDFAQHFDGEEAAHGRGRVFFDDDPAMPNWPTERRGRWKQWRSGNRLPVEQRMLLPSHSVLWIQSEEENVRGRASFRSRAYCRVAYR
jgi:hypothetical protein